MVYANIKSPIFKVFNTIWSLLTEENSPLVDKKEKNVKKSSETVENEESKDNNSTDTVDNKKRRKDTRIAKYLYLI